MQLHATCLSWRNGGILLTGPSGSGKSDLALRMIRSGALLVADDRVVIHADNGRLIAHPPPRLAGKIEVRGVGILPMPHKPQDQVELIIELAADRCAVDRLPVPRTRTELGIALPCRRLYPFDQTTPIKIDLALSLARGEIDLFDGPCDDAPQFSRTGTETDISHHPEGLP